MTGKIRAMVASVVGAVSLVVVQIASAATDTNLTAQTDQIKQYFSDNIGVVVGVFIAVALLLWMFRLATRSAGAKTPSKAG